MQDEKQFAVNRTDSILVKDSIIAPNLYKESWITENIEVHKRNKWQLLAAGSLGTTLVQSVCKFMKSNDITNDLPSGPDQPTDPTNPSEKYFTTWEDYAKELHRISQADPTTENVAMADIADHNSGEIVEVEHHDKPITLSIAVNKNIGKRWSLETGLQYSYLKSYLILGTGSYRVDKEQKLHYLGVPF
ncbi:MAG TPA: RNA polymerase, partial [Bacteroides fragilis]|nr:RNA polymerase [Bacteroides fragilis]